MKRFNPGSDDPPGLFRVESCGLTWDPMQDTIPTNHQSVSKQAILRHIYIYTHDCIRIIFVCVYIILYHIISFYIILLFYILYYIILYSIIFYSIILYYIV